MCLVVGRGSRTPYGAATWENNLAATAVSLQRLVNLDITLQYVGQELRQINAFLFGLTGEVFPDASLDRSRQEDLCARRNVMQTSDSFAEVDLGRHPFI